MLIRHYGYGWLRDIGRFRAFDLQPSVNCRSDRVDILVCLRQTNGEFRSLFPAMSMSLRSCSTDFPSDCFSPTMSFHLICFSKIGSEPRLICP